MRLFFRPTLLCLGLFLLWQGVVTFWQLPDYILPSPLQVLDTLYQQSHVIAWQAWPTLIEMSLGFLFGILLGCLAGFALAFFRPFAFWFLPLLIISQAIPTFAIAPLLVIWLGYGLASKVACAILMVFFPIASAFYDGLRRTPTAWLDLAKTMNASKWHLFCRIQIPAAMPDLSAGIRIAAVFAPIGAVVGEWVGSSQGLGYLMLNANGRMQIDMMFAALLVIILLALMLYFSVDKLLRTFIWW